MKEQSKDDNVVIKRDYLKDLGYKASAGATTPVPCVTHLYGNKTIEQRSYQFFRDQLVAKADKDVEECLKMAIDDLSEDFTVTRKHKEL